MGELFATYWARIIALIALVGIGAVMAVANSGSKVTDQLSNANILVTSARSKLYASPNGYLGFTNANIANLMTEGVVPASMVKGGILQDVWGGPITLSSINNGAGGQIAFTGITNQKECVAFVTSLRDYDALIVGTATYNANNPANPDLVAPLCAGSTTVTLQFS